MLKGRREEENRREEVKEEKKTINVLYVEYLMFNYRNFRFPFQQEFFEK